MNPVAIIQARCGSSRLPGKVLKKLGERTMLEYVVRRCQQSQHLREVMVATTVEAIDDPIEALCRLLGVRVYRGSQDDVLLRYVEAARLVAADPVLRITSDCPLIDPDVIDLAMALQAETSADYAFIEGYPRGTGDAEVMSLSALETALAETEPGDAWHREHVMTYLTDHPEKFRLRIVEAPRAIRELPYRLCVDEPADLDLVRTICAQFTPRLDFRLKEIMAFLAANPVLADKNRHVKQKPA